MRIIETPTSRRMRHAEWRAEHTTGSYTHLSWLTADWLRRFARRTVWDVAVTRQPINFSSYRPV